MAPLLLLSPVLPTGRLFGCITQQGPNKKWSGRKNMRPNCGRFCSEEPKRGRTSERKDKSSSDSLFYRKVQEMLYFFYSHSQRCFFSLSHSQMHSKKSELPVAEFFPQLASNTVRTLIPECQCQCRVLLHVHTAGGAWTGIHPARPYTTGGAVVLNLPFYIQVILNAGVPGKLVKYTVYNSCYMPSTQPIPPPRYTPYKYIPLYLFTQGRVGGEPVRRLEGR